MQLGNAGQQASHVAHCTIASVNQMGDDCYVGRGGRRYACY
jgi:hypothetical protein